MSENKMTVAEKLELVKETVVEGFNSEMAPDDICGLVFQNHSGDVGFGDIPALVKKIGKDEGFIVEKKVRQENCIEEIEVRLEQPINKYSELEAIIANLAATHDLTKSWVKNKLTGMAKEAEIELPQKLNLTKWQEAAIEAVKRNPEISLKDLAKAMAGTIHDPDHYARLVWPVINGIR